MNFYETVGVEERKIGSVEETLILPFFHLSIENSSVMRLS